MTNCCVDVVVQGIANRVCATKPQLAETAESCTESRYPGNMKHTSCVVAHRIAEAPACCLCIISRRIGIYSRLAQAKPAVVSLALAAATGQSKHSKTPPISSLSWSHICGPESSTHVVQQHHPARPIYTITCKHRRHVNTFKSPISYQVAGHGSGSSHCKDHKDHSFTPVLVCRVAGIASLGRRL